MRKIILGLAMMLVRQGAEAREARSQSIWDGAYTEDQAARGATAYQPELRALPWRRIGRHLRDPAAGGPLCALLVGQHGGCAGGLHHPRHAIGPARLSEPCDQCRHHRLYPEEQRFSGGFKRTGPGCEGSEDHVRCQQEAHQNALTGDLIMIAKKLFAATLLFASVPVLGEFCGPCRSGPADQERPGDRRQRRPRACRRMSPSPATGSSMSAAPR